MWPYLLSTQEAEYTQHAIEKLSKVRWAEPLLNELQRRGGLKKENMPLMFEIRFAYELFLAGVESKYEYKTGMGDSSVDFRIPGSPEWLIELVSIRESQGIKDATHTDGLFFGIRLSSDAEDPHQSPEAQMIRAQEKIGEKVLERGIPTKFPVPKNKNSLHIIIIDMRGYLLTEGNIGNWRQIAYGAMGLGDNENIFLWPPANGKPIKGLFEESNPQKAPPLIQEHIHFLGFICEKNYREGEIRDVGYYLANPHLLSNEEVTRLEQLYPLKRKTK